ncbi:MAG: HD domain-containing protein [Bacteroidota bacterium]
MDYNRIISNSMHYVTYLLNCHLKPTIKFHNFHHTLSVVEACSTMAMFYQLSEEKRAILITSAWFHDVGYIKTTEGHEAVSKEFLIDFFKDKEVPKDFIQKCCQCIEATTLGHQPKNKLEAIIKDADYNHVISDNYWVLNERLKKEIESLNDIQLTQEIWYERNLMFLSSLTFATSYYEVKFQGKKEQRIKENEAILRSFTSLKTAI